MAEPKFDIEFLPEATEFMDQLPDKVRKKVIFNLRLAREQNNPRAF
jgi:phage-related protein